MKLTNFYEVLEVDENTSMQEVKKAYFRLIRQHTPDKDPEGFKQLHEAYQAIINENLFDGPVFAKEATQEERELAKNIAYQLDHTSFKEALEMATAGVKKYPGSFRLQYLLCIAYRRNGNPIKSANKIDELLRTNPENEKWYLREQALAYYSRGWKNKCYETFKKAHALGICDPEFVFTFYTYLEEERLRQEAWFLLLDFIREPTQNFNEGNMNNSLFLLNSFASNPNNEDEDKEKAALHLGRIAVQCGLSVPPSAEEIADLFMKLAKDIINENLFEVGEKLFERLVTVTKNEPHERLLAKQADFQTYRITAYEGVPHSVALIIDYYLNKTSEIPERCKRVNVQLVLLTERDYVLGKEDFFKQENPYFFKKFKQTFELMKRPEAEINTFMENLKDELLTFTCPSFYREMYPNGIKERPKKKDTSRRRRSSRNSSGFDFDDFLEQLELLELLHELKDIDPRLYEKYMKELLG